MLTPQLLGSLAANTGVSDSKLQSGLTASSGAVMRGLSDRADDPRVMRDVAQLANQGGEIVEPSSLVDDDSPTRRSGNQLLALATDDERGLIKRLSTSLGVGAGVASTLLGVGSSLVMTWLRKLGRSRGGFDAESMSTLLRDERSKLPSIGAIGGARTAEAGAYREHHKPGRKSVWWLLALIPLALLAWWLFDRERREDRTVRAPTAPRVEPRPQPAPEPEVTPSPRT